MTQRLSRDADLAAAYRHAHHAYLADREQLGDVPEIAGVSAGGMPDRVKCLHALAAHALAAGPGVNPFGDETLDELGEFWFPPCLEELPMNGCGHRLRHQFDQAADRRAEAGRRS